MKALSIQQPWSWLIANGYKNIENCKWTTDYRGFVLIHAGKKEDRSCFHQRYGFVLELPNFPPRETMPFFVSEYETGGIVGYATLQKIVTESDSPWFHGPFGFVLTQRCTVPCIPLRGQRGLFDAPTEVEAQINEIREQRFHESDMAEHYQIRKEWDAYRHEGDETPSWGK